MFIVNREEALMYAPRPAGTVTQMVLDRTLEFIQNFMESFREYIHFFNH